MPWLRFSRRILEHLPLALFLLALAIGLVAYGIAIERYGLFPKSILDDAGKTARTTVSTLRTPDVGGFRSWSSGQWADTLLADISAQRIIAYSGGGEVATPFLILGGRHQFRELCPEHGCLAVAIAPSGEITHAWPFRLNAIIAANIMDEDDYPFELNNFSIERDMYPFAIQQYSNGDLLVTFQQYRAFPYSSGVARIDRDGYPRWFRRDYSHHVPHLTDDGIAFVPSHTIGGAFEVPAGDGDFTLRCDGKIHRDGVNILGPDGALLERIPVLDILLASPEVHVLNEAYPACDPLHLNSIHIVGEDVDERAGIAPGDIVLSLHGVSAFAILDGDTHELKRLVRGTFFKQHDVIHLHGSTFLMFDNRGGERVGISSRLLMVDLATDAQRTIFPTPRTPDTLQLSMLRTGSIDVSPDLQRAIVVYTRRGTAVEVRLADGEILTVYRSLHDVSDLDQFPEERLSRAASFTVYDMQYLHDAGQLQATNR